MPKPARYLTLICSFNLVSSQGARWNTICSSLIQSDKKLEKLGVVEVNGDIVYLEGEDSNV